MPTELPKLTLRDATEENSLSGGSNQTPGPLSPPLIASNDEIGDLHEVPINDIGDQQPSSGLQSNTLDEVKFH